MLGKIHLTSRGPVWIQLPSLLPQCLLPTAIQAVLVHSSLAASEPKVADWMLSKHCLQWQPLKSADMLCCC